MNYGFAIGMALGLAVGNSLIGYFLRGMPVTHSIMFGCLAGAIGGALMLSYYQWQS